MAFILVLLAAVVTVLVLRRWRVTRRERAQAAQLRRRYLLTNPEDSLRTS
jgi:hypothetical protein